MFGQGNDPADASTIKTVITSLFGLVAAMGGGWWTVHQKLVTKCEALENKIDELEKLLNEREIKIALLERELETKQ